MICLFYLHFLFDSIDWYSVHSFIIIDCCLFIHSFIIHLYHSLYVFVIHYSLLLICIDDTLILFIMIHYCWYCLLFICVILFVIDIDSMLFYYYSLLWYYDISLMRYYCCIVHYCHSVFLSFVVAFTLGMYDWYIALLISTLLDFTLFYDSLLNTFYIHCCVDYCDSIIGAIHSLLFIVLIYYYYIYYIPICWPLFDFTFDSICCCIMTLHSLLWLSHFIVIDSLSLLTFFINSLIHPLEWHCWWCWLMMVFWCWCIDHCYSLLWFIQCYIYWWFNHWYSLFIDWCYSFHY